MIEYHDLAKPYLACYNIFLYIAGPCLNRITIEVNEVLQMDAATALKNSPTQFKPHIQCSLMLAVGGAETKEFINQSTELYKSWKENIPINFSQIAGANHFSILDDLCDPTTTLHNNMRQLMEI